LIKYSDKKDILPVIRLSIAEYRICLRLSVDGLL